MNDLTTIESTAIADFKNPDITERRWKVTSGKEEFYLTDTEKEFLLHQLGEGVEFIQIGQLTLSNKIMHIYPIREVQKTREFEIIDGKAVEK